MTAGIALQRQGHEQSMHQQRVSRLQDRVNEAAEREASVRTEAVSAAAVPNDVESFETQQLRLQLLREHLNAVRTNPVQISFGASLFISLAAFSFGLFLLFLSADNRPEHEETSFVDNLCKAVMTYPRTVAPNGAAEIDVTLTCQGDRSSMPAVSMRAFGADVQIAGMTDAVTPSLDPAPSLGQIFSKVPIAANVVRTTMVLWRYALLVTAVA